MKGMGTDDNNRTDLRRGRGVRWIRRRTVVFFHSCLGVAWHPLCRFCLKHRGWNTSDTSAPGLRPGVPLASLWCRLVSAAFAWQAWGNVHCQGVGCTPWRPSGVPLVSLGLRRFCVAGVGQCPLLRGRMYALASLWRPSGVPWSPPLLRGRRGAMSIAKGSDVRPGVPLASLWCPTGVPWSPPLLRGRRPVAIETRNPLKWPGARLGGGIAVRVAE